jgi:hypothetical protein
LAEKILTKPSLLAVYRLVAVYAQSRITTSEKLSNIPKHIAVLPGFPVDHRVVRPVSGLVPGSGAGLEVLIRGTIGIA